MVIESVSFMKAEKLALEKKTPNSLWTEYSLEICRQLFKPHNVHL